LDASLAGLVSHEQRLALIHRVLIADKDYPAEYAILVTDARSIFIRQPKSRNGWTLRQEIRFGTALVTDVEPKGLEDYEDTSLETLAADRENLAISHEMVVSLEMRADKPERRRRDSLVWWVMKRQNEIFQVYSFDLEYRTDQNTKTLKFYAVPLGVFFKPRRMSQTRERILLEYATDILDTYRTVLPASIVSSSSQTPKILTPSEFVAWSKRLF
jgi:hypothetical protein